MSTFWATVDETLVDGAEALEKVMIKLTSRELLDTKSKDTHPSQVKAYGYGCMAHGLGHGSYGLKESGWCCVS